MKAGLRACRWESGGFSRVWGRCGGSGGEFPESFLRKIFENLEIVFFTIKQCYLTYFLWFYELLLEYFCNFDDIFCVGCLFLLLTFSNGGGVC